MKRIIPLLIIIAIAAGGYWWYEQSTATAQETDAEPDQLLGSGTIEADTLVITAELGGRITGLYVDEGDVVEAGELLLELDKTDILAEQVQLEANIATARANLGLVSASPQVEMVALAEAQLAQAEQIRDGAELIWQEAAQLASNPRELDAQISQMQAQVTQAEKQLEMARINLKRAEIRAEAASRNQYNNAGLAENEAAQQQLQAAQQGVKIAEVAVNGTKKQVEHLVNLRNNPLSLVSQANSARAAFNQAEAAVQAAQANLIVAKAEPRPEDVNVARFQLQEAEAALEIVAVQLDKQEITAPRTGLISQRLVNQGELASPGVVLLELSDIETVDLTVYIPETQIGRVKTGQKALVTVDAYPGETFEGHVTFIAHQAEFTPRNVQTQEERVNLVFAVKISMGNPDHRLKPGMPADAEILVEMWSGNEQSAADVGAETETSAEPEPTNPPTPTSRPQPSPTATPQLATPTVAPVAAEIEEAVVIATGLKVRQGPGINFEVAGYLSGGDVVTVLDSDSDTGWLQITWVDKYQNDREGWVNNNPKFIALK
jgi:HlyD family secretion protein